jgi:glycosyltransferase involved in cell wall biosynthesis
MAQPAAFSRTIHFIANCVYGKHLAGGDIHFFEMARAAAEAGYKVNFFGGHALQHHIEAQDLTASITLTESTQKEGINAGSLGGQVALFCDYYNRYRGTLQRLDQIRPEDAVYATTDYWFDVLPVVRSSATAKMMIWHMQAPNFGQIVRRGRADVDAARVASLHYWWSQNRALREFARVAPKRLLYVHPLMKDQLLKRGYRENEIRYISFGVDPDPPMSGEPAPKKYDVVWIGRVHRQKGIDDLLQTLSSLAQEVPDFRALIIGKVKEDLEPEIRKRDLNASVEFSGFVSEEEKFRLFRSSRVYLMPSRFEGSPRVIGEALICGLPVVAYDVPTYRPVFGEFIRYVPCYDVAAFKFETKELVEQARAGTNYLDKLDLNAFKKQCSWATARETFLGALTSLQGTSGRS